MLWRNGRSRGIYFFSSRSVNYSSKSNIGHRDYQTPQPMKTSRKYWICYWQERRRNSRTCWNECSVLEFVSMRFDRTFEHKNSFSEICASCAHCWTHNFPSERFSIRKKTSRNWPKLFIQVSRQGTKSRGTNTDSLVWIEVLKKRFMNTEEA